MRIEHPEEKDIPALRQLWKVVFGDEDAFLDRFFSLAFAPERCLCAREGTVLAAMIHWLPCSRGNDRLGYLYAVATAPEFRGRGICRALMEAAHTAMKEAGYTGALLYPQEEGLREMYRKMGYETATYIGESICSCGMEPAPMHPVTPEEYIRLRRDFLPQQSVVQEFPFIQLMAADFRFYKGLGFLLAAREEKDHLYGAELLGDPHTMPGILCSLGLPFARFRSPGGKLPFAMFRPLIPGAEAPSYFGLPLD